MRTQLLGADVTPILIVGPAPLFRVLKLYQEVVRDCTWDSVSVHRSGDKTICVVPVHMLELNPTAVTSFPKVCCSNMKL